MKSSGQSYSLMRSSLKHETSVELNGKIFLARNNITSCANILDDVQNNQAVHINIRPRLGFLKDHISQAVDCIRVNRRLKRSNPIPISDTTTLPHLHALIWSNRILLRTRSPLNVFCLAMPVSVGNQTQLFPRVDAADEDFLAFSGTRSWKD